MQTIKLCGTTPNNLSKLPTNSILCLSHNASPSTPVRKNAFSQATCTSSSSPSSSFFSLSMILGVSSKFCSSNASAILLQLIWIGVAMDNEHIFSSIERRSTRPWQILQEIQSMEFGLFLVYNMVSSKTKNISKTLTTVFPRPQEPRSMRLFPCFWGENRENSSIEKTGLTILGVMAVARH